MTYVRVMAVALLAATAAPYRPPRTPWGDPDLQGDYTNKYEQSTPLERPDEFAGRRLQDVTRAELAAVLTKREQQVLSRGEGVGPCSSATRSTSRRAAVHGSSSIRRMERSRR